jgi:hypothetical protein
MAEPLGPRQARSRTYLTTRAFSSPTGNSRVPVTLAGIVPDTPNADHPIRQFVVARTVKLPSGNDARPYT